MQHTVSFVRFDNVRAWPVPQEPKVRERYESTNRFNSCLHACTNVMYGQSSESVTFNGTRK